MSPECLYLHTLGKPEDSFTKDQMSDPRFVALTTPGASAQRIMSLPMMAAALKPAPSPAAAAMTPDASKARGPREAFKRFSLSSLNSSAAVLDGATGKPRSARPGDEVTGSILSSDLLTPSVRPYLEFSHPTSGGASPTTVAHSPHRPVLASPWLMATGPLCAGFVLSGATSSPVPTDPRAAQAAAAVHDLVSQWLPYLAPDDPNISSDAQEQESLSSIGALDQIAAELLPPLAALKADQALARPRVPSPETAMMAVVIASEALEATGKPGMSGTDADELAADGNDHVSMTSDGTRNSSARPYGGGDALSAGAPDDDDDSRSNDSRRKQRQRKRGGSRRR
jgi:hypothetical protein